MPDPLNGVANSAALGNLGPSAAGTPMMGGPMMAHRPHGVSNKKGKKGGRRRHPHRKARRAQ